ncbi:MAG: ANTAR domain-containing protein [Pseudonocardiaceae bacterium]
MLCPSKSPSACSRAIENRTVTDYAIGIIMSRTGATPDQALAQLRQLSPWRIGDIRQVGDVRLVDDRSCYL